MFLKQSDEEETRPGLLADLALKLWPEEKHTTCGGVRRYLKRCSHFPPIVSDFKNNTEYELDTGRAIRWFCPGSLCVATEISGSEGVGNQNRLGCGRHLLDVRCRHRATHFVKDAEDEVFREVLIRCLTYLMSEVEPVVDGIWLRRVHTHLVFCRWVTSK